MPFAHVAAWQFLTFFMLLCLMWGNELLDLQSFFFGGKPEPFNLARGCVLSVGILVCAGIVIGNTYLQQKQIITGLLGICSSCCKIRIAHDVWLDIDRYLLKHSRAVFSHGLCPECYQKMSQTVDKL